MLGGFALARKICLRAGGQVMLDVSSPPPSKPILLTKVPTAFEGWRGTRLIGARIRDEMAPYSRRLEWHLHWLISQQSPKCESLEAAVGTAN